MDRRNLRKNKIIFPVLTISDLEVCEDWAHHLMYYKSTGKFPLFVVDPVVGLQAGDVITFMHGELNGIASYQNHKITSPVRRRKIEKTIGSRIKGRRRY